MASRFHVAVFCSEAAYPQRHAFYAGIFGETEQKVSINDGSEGHHYTGSVWLTDGFCFGLLIKPDLTGSVEVLAHVGVIFEKLSEFNGELQRRDADLSQVKILEGGESQIFVLDACNSSVEWELACTELINPAR